jgi:YD repeat-containing protein
VFFVTPSQTVTQDLQLGSSVKTLYQFDAWGNLQLESQLGDTSSASVALYRCTSYFAPDSTHWTFGFPQYVKATASASGLTNIGSWQPGDLSLSQYAYDSRGNQTMDVGWDDRSSTWFGKSTVYNAQGLVQTASDMNGNPPAANAATTMTYAYDTAFLSFPASTASPSPQSIGDTTPIVTGSLYDARFGVQVAAVDPSGNIKNTCVDDFGRPTISQGPLQGGGAASRSCLSAAAYPYAGAAFIDNSNLFTTGATSYVVDAGARRMTRVTVAQNAWAGGAVSAAVSLLDGMGRAVVSTWENDQGQEQGTAQQYLDAELVQRSAVPTAGKTPLWITYQYNALGRKTQVSSPLTDMQGVTSYVTTTMTSSAPNTVTLVEAAGLPTAYTEVATIQYLGSQPRVQQLAWRRHGHLHARRARRLTTAVTPSAVTQQIVFDGLGRVVQRTGTGTGTRTYQFDADGNLQSETDAKGQKTIFTYGDLHRPVSETRVDAAGKTQGSIATTWDVAASSAYTNVIGRPATVTMRDGNGGLVVGYAYGYDGYSNTIEADVELLGEKLPFTTAFDPQGRTWTRVYPPNGGARPQVRYTPWPKTGRTHTIEYAPDGATFTIRATYSQYDPLGRPAATSYGNGSAERAAWTPEGRLASQTVTAADGEVLVNRLYGWSAPVSLATILDCNYTGNAANPLCAGRTGTRAADHGRTFTQTNLRLTTATNGRKTQTDCYDGAGNLTVSDGVAYAYVGDQVSTGYAASPPSSCAPTKGATVFSATYDANGNLTTRSRTAAGRSATWHYGYSVDDQILEVKANAALAASYAYDHTGRRVFEAVAAADVQALDHAVLSPTDDYEIAIGPDKAPAYTIYLVDARGAFAGLSGAMVGRGSEAAARLGIKPAAAAGAVLVYTDNLYVTINLYSV